MSENNPPELKVTAIPAFSDNYIWLLHTNGKQCAVVDPGDSEPVKAFLQQSGLQLAYILITHHHADHIGGLGNLVEEWKPKVFGPKDSRINLLDQVVSEGQSISLPILGLNFKVIEVPGHTRSHIAFYGHNSLFCGDTLFSVGCGRLFEGTAGQMQSSMDKLANLPGDTLIYCAHEYTLGNCRFAVAVEPDNSALQIKLRNVENKRSAGEPTIPSTLAEERATNPFLRTRESAVVAAARQRNPDAEPGTTTFASIREWKDNW